jgi:hypothetical protein
MQSFSLFHVPTGMFADQTFVDDSGIVYTEGFSFPSRDDAERNRLWSADIGLNPAEWSVVETPDNVRNRWFYE